MHFSIVLERVTKQCGQVRCGYGLRRHVVVMDIHFCSVLYVQHNERLATFNSNEYNSQAHCYASIMQKLT